MKLWPCALVLLLLLPNVGGQAGDIVREVAFHEFADLEFEQADFSSACDTGGVRIHAGGRGFDFIEGLNDDGVEADEGLRAYASSGCGTMRKSLQVLPSADHLVVRFSASRDRASYGVDGTSASAIQDLIVRDAGLREVQSRAIFEPTSESSELTPFKFTFVGEVGGNVMLDWVFIDAGFAAQNNEIPGASGTLFDGTVSDASIEAVSAAAPSLVQRSVDEVRDGTRLTTQHNVDVTLPSFSSGAAAIRVRVVPGLDLVDVIAPDGSTLGAPSTFVGGVLGVDHEGVVVEVNPSYVQAVVPQSLVAAHGGGQYVFVFEESRGLTVTPVLLPFSVLLLVAPLPFAVLAWVESRAFRREAFGGYARSARNLQYGVALVFLYYAAVVASAAVGGRLDLMAITPLPLEGVLLYVQLVIAGIAFTALWLVARELFLLVKPRPDAGLDDAF